MPFKLPLIEGLVLVAVAILCVVFQLRMPGKAPTDAEFQEAARALQAEAQPGDVVLLYPWWTEHARVFMPDGLPVVGYQDSDRDDLEQHPRIWVLSQPDMPRASMSDFMRLFGDRRTAVGAERTFGHLHLALYANGRYHPTRFSITDALASAQVYVEGPDGSRQPCQFDGRIHRCGGNSYVGVEWHEVHFQPRRCLRLYPPGGANKLVAELPQVPGADGLSLYAGYTWDRGWFPDRTATDVVAEVNGVSVARINLPAGREGLQRAVSGPVPAGSRVRVWSEASNPDLREICVELYGWGGAP